MAAVEATTTKTLDEGFGPLSSEPAKSHTLMAGSGSEPDENGARVSTGDNQGLKGDICSGAGEETIKAFDSLLGAEGNGIEKSAARTDSTGLVGDGSDRKVEFDENGISLVVEVHGSLESVNESEKKCGYEDDKGGLAENGGVPGEKFPERPSSMYRVGKKGDLTEEKGKKQQVNGNGEERGDGEDVGDEEKGEEDEDDNGKEDVGDQELEYFVGDFVWGKIRSHPWWPGQIYDSSDASEYASKYKQKDRLLVAYFGDGSFSWCFPSQFKPFAENFEEMWKQSNSKSFVNAVQKALDEIGRLVELGMTCSCIPEENRIGLTRALAVNSGIKAGALVPEGDTGKLSIPRHEPAVLLANVRYAAQVVSISSMFELTVLKSWLSAFYRAKGGYSLPIYHEPQHIEGLEDKNRNEVTGTTDFNGPVEVPIQGPFEEDWLSSPVSPRFGQTSQLLQKCPLISKDKLYQRRKQKSVAELMGEDMDVEPKNKKGSVVKEGTHSGKSTSGKKKRKGNAEAESLGDSVLTSPSGRKRGRKKKAVICGSPKSTENKVSSVETGGSGDEDEDNESPVSREWRRNKVSSAGNDDDMAKEETEKISASRERKKSKYLSPPYTNLKWRGRNSRSKIESQTVSEKITKIAQMGERMTRAAGQLIGSPSILKCSGETFQKNKSEELVSRHDTPGSSGPQSAKQDQKKIIVSMEISASTNDVLSHVQSAALNPLYLREKRSLDMITGFISTFRSSIYLNGSNYQMYHKRRPGSKRKSLNSEPGPLGKVLNPIVRNLLEPRSQQTGNEKNEDAKSDEPKLKRAARASGLKTNDKDADRNVLKRAARASGMKTNDKDADRNASPVALIVTFPPGFSLPTKDDLIKIFSKFGALNEKETDVLYNSYCARLVFVRSSDAEEAYKISVKKRPFGAANVNYRLRYPPAASRANELNQNASSPLNKTPENQVAPQPSDDEVPRLHFIRQKLEMITSMLENSDGKISPEMKSNLEGEMKGLLKKVKTMEESSSS